DLALGAGDRRIVDDRRLVGAAVLDVAVDRVVAGVADAVREPAAVDAGRRIEDLFRALDPVDRVRRLSPEAHRILQRAPVGLVVAAGARLNGVLPGLDTSDCAAAGALCKPVRQRGGSYDRPTGSLASHIAAMRRPHWRGAGRFGYLPRP